MIRSLFIAKTGLEAQQTNLDVISNNLANVSTNVFKNSLVSGGMMTCAAIGSRIWR